MAGKCDHRTPVDTLIRRLLNPRDRVCGGEKLGGYFSRNHSSEVPLCDTLGEKSTMMCRPTMVDKRQPQWVLLNLFINTFWALD